MKIEEFTEKIEKMPANYVYGIIKAEFGDIRTYKIQSCYEQTVFEERIRPESETTFGTNLIDVANFYLYYTEETPEKGILDKTMIIRIYDVLDKRDYVDDITILTIETKIGKVKRGEWGLPCEPEAVVANIEDFQRFASIMVKEFSRNPREPKYIIWRVCDPYIMGDYYSESYREVYYIGYQDKCEEYYERYRNGKRFAGNSSTYCTYPTLLSERDKSLEVGDRETIRPALSKSEENMIEMEYENEELDSAGEFMEED